MTKLLAADLQHRCTTKRPTTIIIHIMERLLRQTITLQVVFPALQN